MTAGSLNKANIFAVIGATGTGKGWYIKTKILPLAGRVFVWSPLEESDNYSAILKVKPLRGFPGIRGLIDAWMAGKSAVFVPSNNPKLMKEEFLLFCRAAWHFKGAAIHVEELSNVTSPTHAVPPWKKLSTACRHQGTMLIGASQRPAQVDKDFLGGVTEIVCFRLMYENDAKVMASVLRVDWRLIMDLPDHHFIHRDTAGRVNTFGNMQGQGFDSLEKMLGKTATAAPQIPAKPPIPRKTAKKAAIPAKKVATAGRKIPVKSR